MCVSITPVRSTGVGDFFGLGDFSRIQTFGYRFKLNYFLVLFCCFF